ncbi:MAG: hypothetical protein HY036_02125 [Nitrospirae bacterium]|nr:hypothetical protein [Nitrospirota bacterium]MBI3351354.1 hypothetical protein [Nitrospirota bacterium]
MKLIGQSESYSEILERVFVTTLAVGFFCTILLANADSTFHDLLETISTKVDFGPLKDIKVLYVVVPLVLAGISRLILLHDKISNILGLRKRFDTNHILFPMADQSGYTLTDAFKQRLTANRKEAMSDIFYRYASFINPVIDRQLVRTAADNWGWLWSAVEASFVCLVTLSILTLLEIWSYAMMLGGSICILIGFIFFQWFQCRKGAVRQVRVIMEDSDRKQAIHSYFTKFAASVTLDKPESPGPLSKR